MFTSDNLQVNIEYKFNYCVLYILVYYRDLSIGEANLAMMEGIHMYSIGIGEAAVDSLQTISSLPYNSTLFYMKEYGQLPYITDSLLMSMCYVNDITTLADALGTLLFIV